ncbi:DUF1295 domain protein [Trichodelitschia bisporula]|uniref:DUF1295 domain protein n=1 Tax=Trichodelitschia bisporula TaxID=703511 RepID=A0A6G1I8W3_9PEZI|nr:DUF1295 domain protein [Trichodelitschia bisporula]
MSLSELLDAATPGAIKRFAPHEHPHLHASLNKSAPIPLDAGDVGLLKSTLLPSFGIQSGLSLITYIAARASDRVELKDWLWPAGQVVDVWWSAVGHRMAKNGMPFTRALGTLTWNERLLLGGHTLWGTRLFYREVSRSIRRGKEDHHYGLLKQEDKFWNHAFLRVFLPEAIFRTLATVPLTLALRLGATDAVPVNPEYARLIQGVGISLFCVGFVMEVLADFQLEHHDKKASLKRDGVWSIVRHPNYLGDALMHLSFSTLLYSSGQLHPFAVVGPLANYVFLRYVSGDKRNYLHQGRNYKTRNTAKFVQLEKRRDHKNSFWPGLYALGNPWTWVMVAVGGAGVVAERMAREYFTS